MPTFVLENVTDKRMSVYSLGIPFKIICSGDAARQFYNPLQDRDASTKNAALDGKVPANVALKFDFGTNFYSQFYF